MAAPTKKRNVKVDEKNSPEDAKNGSEVDEQVAREEVIQVDFEGRNPVDSDFHGIKQLLSQLFLKAHLNVSELTELIIGQNFVGSVIKQAATEDEGDDDDDDDDDSDPNEVFGITTIINLTEKQKFECVEQLRTLLLNLCKQYGSGELLSLVENLLSDNKNSIGLLINERFVNIPAQISVPLLKSLRSELKRAVEKKMAYNFSYLIMISKLYKMEMNSDKKKLKKGKKNIMDSEIIWSNPEEEVIDQEAEAKFEFSVKDEADSGLIGKWDVNDDEMTPMRRVLIIPYERLDRIIEKVEEAVSA